jgi:hypothetical protein
MTWLVYGIAAVIMLAEVVVAILAELALRARKYGLQAPNTEP